MGQGEIKKFCTLTKESQALLKRAIDELGLSARAHDKILKVARTIADLEKEQKNPHRTYRRGHPIPYLGSGLVGVIPYMCLIMIHGDSHFWGPINLCFPDMTCVLGTLPKGFGVRGRGYVFWSQAAI